MIRVLILGQGQDKHTALESTLAEAGYEIHCAETASAVEAISHWHPLLIIIDSGDPAFDSATAVARLRSGPRTANCGPIIVLSPNNSVEERIEVIRAGAEDCLDKPYASAELLIRMHSILTRSLAIIPPASVERTSGQILVFYGSKGGVGTTTIAINTALSLRRLSGARVALIDANFQFGDHRLFLDAELDRPAIDRLIDGEPLNAEQIQASMFHDGSGVDALLSSKTPESAELVTADHISYILAQLRDRYDYIVVDLDQHLDDRCLRIIDAANELFIVLISEMASVKNTRLMMGILERINFPPEKIHLIQNRVGAITGISTEGMVEALRRPLDYQIVNDYRSAIAALNSGQPAVKAKPNSALGVAFETLVRQAILKDSAAPASGKKRSFFSR